MSIQNDRSQYLYSTLCKDNLPDQPWKQLELWLEQAKQSNIRDYNTMAVATADSEGRPTVRNVLLKSLDKDGLTFHTNNQSEKAQQLFKNKHTEFLFFWREFNRQVRVRGLAYEVDRTITESYFQSRPLESQQASAVSNQSQSINSRKELESNFKKFITQNPNHVKTPTEWTGFCLEPNYWEFWQGREHRLHDRLTYQKNTNNTWSITRLQP